MTTAKSSDATQEAMVWTIGTSLNLALAGIPGMDIVQFGGMAIDIIDPYGYSQAVTRGAMDDAMGDVFDTVSGVAGGQKIKDAMSKRYENELKLDMSLPKNKKLLDKVMKRMAEHYKVANVIMPKKDECFQDFGVGGGGPKKDGGCPSVYKKAYETFHAQHKLEYIASNTKNVAKLESLALGGIEFHLDKLQTDYRLLFNIVVGVFAVALLIGLVAIASAVVAARTKR